MRDTNLLLTDASISADAFAANALNLDGTPAEGVWLQFHITKTGADSDERLDITVYGKDTDSSWATTDTPLNRLAQVGSGLATSGVLIRYLLVQTKLNYIKPYYDVSGTTPGFSVVCSVVSGPDQWQTGALS